MPGPTASRRKAAGPMHLLDGDVLGTVSRAIGDKGRGRVAAWLFFSA